MSDESHHERELGGQLLASVSRSFYLTLKALPQELREPISLAYLLARTADTIADTASVPAEVRLRCLEQFRGLVLSEQAGDQSLQLAESLRRDFQPAQTDEAERRLMERFEEALAWLRTMKGAALHAIRQVLDHIITGQVLDIQRFPSDGQLRSLKTPAELEEYTWLVAGCVGEFWTEMCASELPASLNDSVSVAQMTEWGAEFGKGLQLINILRDVGEDIQDGRCYLPEEEWHALNLTLEGVQQKHARLRPLWEAWLKRCRQYLTSGLAYVQHVNDGKLRYATALPLMIGIKTVVKMEKADWEQVLKGVKVSRMEIAMLLAETALACRTPEGVGRLYQKLSG